MDDRHKEGHEAATEAIMKKNIEAITFLEDDAERFIHDDDFTYDDLHPIPNGETSTSSSIPSPNPIAATNRISTFLQRKRPKEAFQDIVYNFAFGSNIYPPANLVDRGGLQGIKYESFQLARANGYRLDFRTIGLAPLEPSFAALCPIPPTFSKQIESDKKSPYHLRTCFDIHVDGYVYGSVIKFKQDEYQKLWVTEGGRMRPTPYREVIVECELLGDEQEATDHVGVSEAEHASHMPGKKIRAIGLVYQNYRLSNRDLIPSTRYLRKIKNGAKKLGVPPEYLDLLEAIPETRPLHPINRSLSNMIANLYLLSNFLVWPNACMPIKIRMDEFLGLYTSAIHHHRMAIEYASSKHEQHGRVVLAKAGYSLSELVTGIELVPLSLACQMAVFTIKYWRCLHILG